MFRSTAEAIAASNISTVLQDVSWLVPVSQSIHIVGLSVVFASAMMINLRLLGVGTRGRTVSSLVATLSPWMWRGLLVCLATGLLQTVIEPLRQFVTPIFWGKMLLIACMAMMTFFLVRTVRLHSAEWDAPDRPPVGQLFAVVSSLAWITIVAFGRFIGYVWALYA